jgi:DNA repair exonuclease SbcCD ATPase subunit
MQFEFAEMAKVAGSIVAVLVVLAGLAGAWAVTQYLVNKLPEQLEKLQKLLEQNTSEHRKEIQALIVRVVKIEEAQADRRNSLDTIHDSLRKQDEKLERVDQRTQKMETSQARIEGQLSIPGTTSTQGRR